MNRQLTTYKSVLPVQTNPTTSPQKLNRYAYVENNPINLVDPLGLVVTLQWHRVLDTNNYHTLTRITPDNQAKYLSDPRFSNIDHKGMHYATMGAGPEDRLLVSNFNRPFDVGFHRGGIILNNPFKSEAKFIEELFKADANYNDDREYDFFPADSANAKWWFPDAGYNSNSYTSGLHISIGVQLPNISLDVPGWDKPVPVEYYRP